MLYIVGIEGIGETGKTQVIELSWHVGENIPSLRDVDVTEVQADSEELIYIINLFKNLPHTDKRLVVRWFGDMAKFIAHNLER